MVAGFSPVPFPRNNEVADLVVRREADHYPSGGARRVGPFYPFPVFTPASFFQVLFFLVRRPSPSYGIGRRRDEIRRALAVLYSSMGVLNLSIFSADARYDPDAVYRIPHLVSHGFANKLIDSNRYNVSIKLPSPQGYMGGTYAESSNPRHRPDISRIA